MTNLKSILLGTGAAIVAATATAQAADLPIVEPVDYVQICDLYGNGYFYLPGTNTCLKVGGFARFQGQVNDENGSTLLGGQVFGLIDPSPIIQVPGTGVGAVPARFVRLENDSDNFTFQTRGRINFDARTETDLGTLRSFIQMEAGNTPFDDTFVDLDLAYVQFNVGPAVMTAGLAPSLAGVTGPSVLEDSAFGSGGGDSIQLGFAFDIGPFQAGIAIVDPRQVIRPGVGTGVGGFSFTNAAGVVVPVAQGGLGAFSNNGALGSELPYLEAEANFALAGITVQTGAAIGEVNARVRAFDQFGNVLTRDFDEVGYALAAAANATVAGFKIGAGASYSHGLTDFGINDANPFRNDFALGRRIGVLPGTTVAAQLASFDFELVDAYSFYGQIGADIGIFEVNLIGTYGEIEFPTFATAGGVVNGGDNAEAYSVHLNAAIAPVEGLTIAAEVFYADLDVDRNVVVSQGIAGLPNRDGSVDNDSFGGILRIQRNF